MTIRLHSFWGKTRKKGTTGLFGVLGFKVFCHLPSSLVTCTAGMQ